MKPFVLFIFCMTTAAAFAEVTPDVIYGDDDRLDLYEVQDEAILALAKATVGLVNRRNLSSNESGYSLRTQHYGESYNLCESEPFRNQRTGAFCSGFLVAPDTIMTAGHCIRTQSSCENTSFVFDFALAEEGSNSPTQFSNDNVYHCEKVVRSEVDGDGVDFAIVKIDRPVTNRTPVVVRQSGQVTPDTALTVIGHPAGLPTKVAGGASVRSLEDGFFIANLDTYGGNSGSAVFNSKTGEVEGILVRGELDFVYKNGCRVSNVCTNEGCRGEDVTSITRAVPFL